MSKKMKCKWTIQEDMSSREPLRWSKEHTAIEQWADGKWYFWSETWTEAYGPFDTKEDACAACSEYAKTI